MPRAQLYFLSNEYYQDFPDDKLMQNKDTIDGVPHSRPCFFAFSDARIPEIYWIVPISSKYEKYKRIEQDKIKKYGRCNTIRFGTVLGRNTVEQIQAGVVAGYVGNMEYLIRQVMEEMNCDGIKVIATGGLSRMIAQQTDRINIVDTMLTLDGLRMIYDENRDAKPIEVKN